jgi:hypothetical protein
MPDRGVKRRIAPHKGAQAQPPVERGCVAGKQREHALVGRDALLPTPGE